MGLLDNLGGSLKGALGEVETGAIPALISAALAKSNLGDLQGLVDKLQQGGLGPQVQSWLGDGKNLPVTPDEIKSALGNTQVQQLAEHFGIPVDSVLKFLSEKLPNVVDQASPDGTVKS